METTYILKLYDEPILSFRVAVNSYGQLYYTDEMLIGSEHLLPPSLQSLGLEKWLKSRIVPKNRELVNEIFHAIGNPTQPIDIIDVSMLLSLTDSYWIVKSDFEGRFSNYNLFENEFSKALELVAFTGYNTKISGIITSPEFTTNGMLKKCWRRIHHSLYLYKGGTSGFANTGLEPYSEYYACQIATAMGLRCVTYDLAKFKGQLVSVCKAFTDINTSYVPIWTLLKTDRIDEKIEVYGKEDFANLIVFDAVICNTDRHTGNYGLLRENATGKYLGAAPIFDNGLSLFNYAMKDDFEDIESYAKTRFNSFNADQVTMAKSVMTDSHRAMLRSLINFKFVRHTSYNLPEWRLKKIEAFIGHRIIELLK